MIGAAFTGMGIYEALASTLHGTLISHARGFWRWLVIGLFGLFIGHAVVQWARDDVAARAAEAWTWR